jgi:hypothetical protein
MPATRTYLERLGATVGATQLTLEQIIDEHKYSGAKIADIATAENRSLRNDHNEGATRAVQRLIEELTEILEKRPT